MKEKIKEYLENNLDNIISDLKGLMQINSVCTEAVSDMPYGEGSAKALDYIRQLSDRMGLKTRTFQNYVVTADYGEPENDVALGILAHVDVVPEGDGWTYPCFDLTIDNGRAYGRGAIDDKGPAVAVLYAVKALDALGIKLKKNVRYIFGGGEEIGCNDIEYYQEQEALPDMLLTPDGEFPIVNAEKGIVQAFATKTLMPSKLIELKCIGAVNAVPAKATARITGFLMDDVLNAIGLMTYPTEFKLEQDNGDIIITSIGKAAHGSRPQLGMNALTALLGLLSELEIDEAKELCSLFAYNEYNGKSLGIDFSDEASGELTLALTVCDIEKSQAKIGLDTRFPISKTFAEVSEPITRKLEEIGYTITDTHGMEAHYVDENSEFISAVKRAYRQVFGEEAKCVCETGATYVHNTLSGVAFGPEMSGENNGMHSANESISLDRLVQLAQVYAQAIIEICG